MKYLFPNFLNNTQEYKKSLMFWESLCQQVLSKYFQSDLWIPWFGFNSKVLIEEAVRFEGNPMYWLVNPTRLKEVHIIQQDPKIHTRWEMAAWTNIVDDEYSKLGLTKQLVFACNLTEETANIFEKLFEVWIQTESTVSSINEMIKDLNIKQLLP